MDEKQKAGFRALEKSGYLKQVREFAMGRCAPFFWSMQKPGKPAQLLHNGTICYVRTGQRDIGITADHVYKQYAEDLAGFPDVEAQFGGRVSYPQLQIIDRNPQLDLATFNVPAEFVALAHKTIHTPPGWPPRPLQPGDLVIYGGYPGILKEPGSGQIVWPFQSFTWRVTDVTEQSIVMHVDFPNLLWSEHEEEKMNENLGGMSGGPVFRLVEDLQNRRVYYELVGIIYEYYQVLEVVRARHIRHVLADGSLLPF